jgi:hypothetical protein
MVNAMDDEAFQTLDAINRGRKPRLVGADPWLAAFNDIGWVEKSKTGFILTAAGRRALKERALEHWRGDHACPVREGLRTGLHSWGGLGNAPT